MLGSRNPQLQASNYVLNIQELQNTITSASGLTPIGVLGLAVGHIQEMVDYDTKTVKTNTFSKFSGVDSGPISLINDLNLCNASLYSNGVLFSGSGTSVSFSGGGTGLAIGSTSIVLVSTSVNGGPLISLNVGGSNVFNVASNGNVSFYNPLVGSASGSGGQLLISSTATLGIASNADLGKSLLCMDLGGNAGWGYVSTLASADTIRFLGTRGEVGRLTSAGNLGLGVTNPTKTLEVKGTGSFTGRLQAFEFLTLSDRRYKTNITRIENAGNILEKVQGVRFNWRGGDLSSCDVGVIAQDLQTVLPEAVIESEEWIEGEEQPKLLVAYHKITPVLIEVVNELRARVSTLEGRLPV